MGKTILTVGVYDMLHIGHILLFKRAKELGDRLIVAVQDGEYIQKYKPGTSMVYTTEERMYMVSTIRYVDEVVTYQDVDVDIQNIEQMINSLKAWRKSDNRLRAKIAAGGAKGPQGPAAQ